MFKTFNGCAAETIVVVKADTARRLRKDKADIFEDIDVNIKRNRSTDNLNFIEPTSFGLERGTV